MNERIKELAEQADIKFDKAIYEIDVCVLLPEDLEKFAELIVKECIARIQPMWDQVQKYGPPPGYDFDTFDLAYTDCMNAIKEHFGVK